MQMLIYYILTFIIFIILCLIAAGLFYGFIAILTKIDLKRFNK